MQQATLPYDQAFIDYSLETDSPDAYGPLRDAGKLDHLLLGQPNGDPLPQSLSLHG